MNDVIIVPTTTIKNVLFVNSAVLSLSDYINSDTIEIGYDTHVSTIIPSAKNHNNVTRIGFAFHYSGEDDDHEAFFTDSDLGESVETFSPNVQSMLDLLLGGGITHVDFLACGTLKSEKWRLFYQLLRLKTGVVIGASDDNTGNMKLGGDWIMESTHEEVGQIYFTSEIVNWASLLGTYTDPFGVIYTNITSTTASLSARNNESLVSYTIPTTVTIDSILCTVTTIPAEAFFCNLGKVSRLTSIIIPSTITSIGGYAFTQTLLTTVNIPSSVTTISDFAFYINETLASITFSVPSSLRIIPSNAFRYITNLTCCWLPHGVRTIGSYAFTKTNSNDTVVQTIVLPNTIVTLDSTCFYGPTAYASAKCGNLYMYTSTDSGVTCLYKKFVGTMPEGNGTSFTPFLI